MTPRCFVDPAEWLKPSFTLGPDDAHHWIDVLRINSGDRAVVCDGLGGEAVVRIVAIEGGKVIVNVLERRLHDSSRVMITLVQAIPKAQKIDWIIQKATELGVWSILPVMTEHGVVKLEDERAGQRHARWQRIATEAAKQCRTPWIPRVAAAVKFKTLLATPLPADVMVIGSLEPDALPFKRCLADLAARRPKSVALLIGPEGDFSPAEYKMARVAGAIPVSYGTPVLRVETAALYGLSVLVHAFGVVGANGTDTLEQGN
jgi:16S rRNA (uracil1498-N3)-methyltransferase